MSSHPITNDLQGCRRKPCNRVAGGFSLLELVVSMGLLSMIMVPVVGLLSTSYQVMQSNSSLGDGAYVRHSTLDAVDTIIRQAAQVTHVATNRLSVRFSNGATGELTYTSGELRWSLSGAPATAIARGLSTARFSVVTANGSPAVAGELIRVQVATRSSDDIERWSNSQIWIRPAL